MVIDYPFDQEGRTPRDDRAKVLDFQATGESSNSLVWLPCFFSRKTLEDLGRLVLLDHILSGNNLNQIRRASVSGRSRAGAGAPTKPARSDAAADA